MSRKRNGHQRAGWRGLCEFRGCKSDLWEANAGYKITLPIQIGKLMVAFVDSLFGTRDNGRLLSYYPEIVR